MLEKAIVTKIIKWLRDRGGYVIKYHGGPYARVGAPDVIAAFKGRFVGIEVKRPGGKTTKLQEINLQEIRNAGGIAFVATSVEDVSEKLNGGKRDG